MDTIKIPNHHPAKSVKMNVTDVLTPLVVSNVTKDTTLKIVIVSPIAVLDTSK